MRVQRLSRSLYFFKSRVIPPPKPNQPNTKAQAEESNIQSTLQTPTGPYCNIDQPLLKAQAKKSDVVKLIIDSFDEFITLCGLKKESIDYAYILGSYSRGDHTKFSDIDLNFLTNDGTKKDVAFQWKNKLVSIFVQPVDSITNFDKSEPNSLLWHSSHVSDIIPIFDRNNTREKTEQTITTAMAELNSMPKDNIDSWLITNVRRMGEYRAKIFSRIEKLNKREISKYLFSLNVRDFSMTFVKNYIFIKYHQLNNEPIPSEKNFYDIVMVLPPEIQKAVKILMNSNNSNTAICKSMEILMNDLAEVSPYIKRELAKK